MAEWEKPTLQAPTEQSNLWSKRLEEFFKDRKHEEDGFSFTQKSELLSTSDRVKNYIQAFTSVPIIWWPFSDPRRQLKHGKTRMAWQCVRPSFYPLETLGSRTLTRQIGFMSNASLG